MNGSERSLPAPAHVIELDGAVAVWEFGSGAPVICVHGFPDHAAGMFEFAKRLAGHGHRALVPALPGYFPSGPRADQDYSTRAISRVMLDLLDALDIERVGYVGHDWGAMFGYFLGSHAPERVSALVALAAPHPAGFAPRRRLLREQRAAAYAYVLAYDSNAVEIATDPVWLTAVAQDWSPALRRDDWDLVLDILSRREVGEAVVRYYAMDLGPERIDDQIGQVATPTTIIHGAQDGTVRPSLFAGIDDCFAYPPDRHLIADVGHWPHLEAPAQVERIVVDALAA